jgi:hypothetical protein
VDLTLALKGKILVYLVPYKNQLLMQLQQEVVHEDYFAAPVGFFTDLATVPKWLESFIKPYGLVSRAAILHDFAYIYNPIEQTRKEADEMFLQVMLEDGVNGIKARLMYAFVRLVSWIWWKEFRKLNKQWVKK